MSLITYAGYGFEALIFLVVALCVFAWLASRVLEHGFIGCLKGVGLVIGIVALVAAFVAFVLGAFAGLGWVFVRSLTALHVPLPL